MLCVLCRGCDGCCVFCLYCEAWSCRCSCLGSVSVSSCRCCMFVSCVHPVAVLNAAFCMTCSLLILYHLIYIYILSVYSPFSDRVGRTFHNILYLFPPVMDIFSVHLMVCHIQFYTL